MFFIFIFILTHNGRHIEWRLSTVVYLPETWFHRALSSLSDDPVWWSTSYTASPSGCQTIVRAERPSEHSQKQGEVSGPGEHSARKSSKKNNKRITCVHQNSNFPALSFKDSINRFLTLYHFLFC